LEEKRWFDVFFGFNGFLKIEAKNETEAMLLAEELLEKDILSIEKIIKTGVAADVYCALGE